MKLNIIGLIAAILAFISIALPWWTLTLSYMGLSYTISLNLWGFSGIPMGISLAAENWYIWAALALIGLGGFLGLVGSFLIGRNGKTLLGTGGLLAILSPIIFAVGASSDLSKIGFGLFYSGKWLTYLDASAYLSFGFFLAFIAAIVMLIATRKHPMEAGAVAPPPPQ